VPSAVTTSAADGPIVGEAEGEGEGEGEEVGEGDGDGCEPMHPATIIAMLATVTTSCSVILRTANRIVAPAIPRTRSSGST
jgi:hypothetical protein